MNTTIGKAQRRERLGVLGDKSQSVIVELSDIAFSLTDLAAVVQIDDSEGFALIEVALSVLYHAVALGRRGENRPASLTDRSTRPPSCLRASSTRPHIPGGSERRNSSSNGSGNGLAAPSDGSLTDPLVPPLGLRQPERRTAANSNVWKPSVGAFIRNVCGVHTLGSRVAIGPWVRRAVAPSFRSKLVGGSARQSCRRACLRAEIHRSLVRGNWLRSWLDAAGRPVGCDDSDSSRCLNNL